MSGKDENPNQSKLVCPHCGHEVFMQILYGYQIQYFNPTTREEWDRGWESNDAESWECVQCERPVSEEIRVRLMEMIFG